MNRLTSETSPYLRQHAANPVDWYPWGDEAFARARAEDRPVLLSVGYSACHWCHVMAHESFEDRLTAEEINARYVAVKVDREERPDVDAVYMEAVQALTGAGGWPMTVFLLPDGRPFYGGTYFPPHDRPGLPSFRRVLEAVDDVWRHRRPDVERQAAQLAKAVSGRMQMPLAEATRAPAYDDGGGAGPRVREEAVAELGNRFDTEWGGFGGPPKFPQPQLVELCLQHHWASGDPPGLAMATRTLEAMAAGGIYDHLGGGFARYATDRTWTVPHFEKMLYDQAGLVRVYLHAWLTTGEQRWLQVVEETVDYVLRDLLAGSSGGLCAAEDADSEGVEGRFYLWTTEELAAATGPELARDAARWYGVTAEGNFEGRSILRRPPGAALERPVEIEDARRRMFAARSERVRPSLDDKVLTEWNAMFGSSLAEAAAATGCEQWRAAAERLGIFLLAELRRPDGRWLRSWQDGNARHLAYAGDYAWLVDFFTRLGELTGTSSWLEHARDTARRMLQLFASDRGLLFTTGNDAEALVVRPMEVLDGAVPSPNSVAAGALMRLGALLGESALTDGGEAILASLETFAAAQPLASANAVAARALAHGGVTEVVIAGDRPDLLQALRARYEPTAVVAWGEPTASPLWTGRSDGYAYVCRRYSCRMPAATPEELEERLDDEHRADRGRSSALGA